MAQLPMESTKKTIIAMLAISPAKGNFLVVWFDWVTPKAPRTMPAAKIKDNRPLIFWPRVVGMLMLDEYSPLVESESLIPCPLSFKAPSLKSHFELVKDFIHAILDPSLSLS
ncbi:MAG: hypothetical protein IIC33_05470 [Chloroflexi bacterium]|nr:hypothetical protein [Chloroflexota bacterium]